MAVTGVGRATDPPAGEHNGSLPDDAVTDTGARA